MVMELNLEMKRWGISVVIQLFYIVGLKFVYCYTWLLFNYLSVVVISEKFNSKLST